ncbi:DUF6959 family protein [Paracidovorax valerianellae]|uniref:DUF6959 family protein n=1 Tax=Paracidovorax valerianellae TaxID=187868 RepID=UPI000B87C090|nr:hypothetical protein [Paracidovorax valerianellae]MDA8447536.1 hypothetical protein [Paracidovorax valerianellae]
MNKHVELLGAPINYAVVQLPDRKFPGVVFQGDSLHSLFIQIKETSEILQSGQVENAMVELNDMRDHLKEVLDYFEKICEEKQVALPYPSES